MRILRVAQKIYPEAKGGGAYHVHAMSRDQAAMGHDVTVLTVGDGQSPEERDGYKVVRKPAIVEPLGNAISPGVANYLRKANCFDVIHAHSHLYFSTNLAALARRFGETPLAITNHGLYSQTAPAGVFDGYLQTLGRWTFNQADVVFTYTDEERAELCDLGVKSDIEVVSNGIDTERFTPEGPGSDLIDSEGPVVLFVGRFVDGKRPLVTVESFAEVLKEHPDAQMYLCGDGPLRKKLESRVQELGIESAVTFLGHVPYDEMPAMYRGSDVLVLPSRAEGVPRTVLEAMASGVPVVVSDLEQIDAIISERSRKVLANSDEEIADAVSEILDATEGMTNSPIEDYEWTSTVEQTTKRLESLSY
jgi:glycogen(starch) synthase